MQQPESRLYFELCDPKAYVSLRDSLFVKRDDLKGLAGVGYATIQRLDAAIRKGVNHRLQDKIARAIHKAFEKRAQEKGASPVCTFPQMFKLAEAKVSGKRSFKWTEIVAFAKSVGEDVFNSFRADAVLTFSGHSALFASLVMVTTLGPEKLLNMPVYLAQQRVWKPPLRKRDLPHLWGFESLPGDRFVILMPEALEKGDLKRKKRIAIIDDSIVSGEVPPVLRDYFRRKKYPDDSIRIACAVSVKLALKRRRPDYSAWQIDTTDFSLPWGEPLLFGE